MNAQEESSHITGEYYLQGVMETASVIQLKPDSTFEFFFSYGAVDRSGTGKWIKRHDTIILNSRPRPALDFALTESRKTTDSFITIKIADKNTMLLSYVECVLNTGAGPQQLTTDHEGIARFPLSAVDSVALLFTLCPDRISSFHPAGGHNYFEFRFEPWIAEVFFDHLSLLFERNKLTGGHPLLHGGKFNYVKNE